MKQLTREYLTDYAEHNNNGITAEHVFKYLAKEHKISKIWANTSDDLADKIMRDYIYGRIDVNTLLNEADSYIESLVQMHIEGIEEEITEALNAVINYLKIDDKPTYDKNLQNAIKNIDIMKCQEFSGDESYEYYYNEFINFYTDEYFNKEIKGA